MLNPRDIDWKENASHEDALAFVEAGPPEGEECTRCSGTGLDLEAWANYGADSCEECDGTGFLYADGEDHTREEAEFHRTIWGPYTPIDDIPF